MKKCILVCVCLFLMTGCSATYNVSIDDDKINETTSFLGSSDNYSDENKYEFEMYLNDPFPQSKNNSIVGIEDYSVLNKIKLYNTEDLSNGNNFGLKVSGLFDKDLSISDSAVIFTAAPNAKINVDNDNIKVYIPDFTYLFEKYSSLDNLTINVKLNAYKMFENNADSVKDNTYTWEINRSNYKSKNIKFTVQKSMRGFVLNFTKNNYYFSIGVFLLVTLIIGLLIYYFVRLKSASNNEF